MSNLLPDPELQPQVETFIPNADEPLSGAAALLAAQHAIEASPDDVDLVLEVQQPDPIGRSWDFDFATRSFIRAPRGTGPLETRDLGTLARWIEKCLNTARGAHPVHPPGYGMITASSDIVGQSVGMVPADLLDRIRDALTFHPRITDVTDLQTDFDPDDEYLRVDFTVHTDDEAALSVGALALTLGL